MLWERQYAETFVSLLRTLYRKPRLLTSQIAMFACLFGVDVFPRLSSTRLQGINVHVENLRGQTTLLNSGAWKPMSQLAPRFSERTSNPVLVDVSKRVTFCVSFASLHSPSPVQWKNPVHGKGLVANWERGFRERTV